MARTADTPELARKREREAQMVSQMIALWCRGHHGGGHAVEQAGDDEPVREKIREVMRWSGPRMIRYRPITAVRHAIITVQSKRAAARSK